MLGTIDNHGSMFVIAVFVLLFTVIWNTLKRSSIFPENICLVIALCVSVLCIIGLFGLGKTEARLIKGPTTLLVKDTPPATPAPRAKPDKKKINFILLPYAALAISILFVFILLMLSKAWPGIKDFFGALSYHKDGRISIRQHFTKSQTLPRSFRKNDWNTKSTLGNGPKRTKR